MAPSRPRAVAAPPIDAVRPPSGSSSAAAGSAQARKSETNRMGNRRMAPPAGCDREHPTMVPGSQATYRADQRRLPRTRRPRLHRYAEAGLPEIVQMQIEALHPAVHLHARLSQHARDRRDVAAMLAQQRDQLLAPALVL